MKTISTMLAALMLAVLVGVTPATAKAKPRATAVRGGYVNEAGCVPVGLSAPDENGVSALECTGGSIWNGDLTGHTVVHLVGTADTSLRMWAEYEELFVGRYAGDGSYGGLHLKGTAWVDENGAFHAEADIVGGTCAWAGSSGTFTYDGHVVNGGYVGSWRRPATAPVVEPGCNPAESPPLPAP